MRNSANRVCEIYLIEHNFTSPVNLSCIKDVKAKKLIKKIISLQVHLVCISSVIPGQTFGLFSSAPIKSYTPSKFSLLIVSVWLE